MEFIYAKELNKEFLVYGNFYDLKLSSGQIIPCRNVLEIYRNGHHLSRRLELFSDKPDALFIMMNPGSSKPLQNKYVPPELSYKTISKQLLGQSIIKTKPDNTQYQLMRIMKAMNWDHVRVLNLSDIRETKSKTLFEQINKLDDPIHSIFCPERKKELKRAIVLKNHAYIICAWGVDENLLKLSNLCLDSIPGRKITGFLKADNLYYHPYGRPFAKQVEWLDKIMECLAG